MLSFEIWQHVFEYLTLPDLCAVSVVSRYFYSIKLSTLIPIIYNVTIVDARLQPIHMQLVYEDGNLILHVRISTQNLLANFAPSALRESIDLYLAERWLHVKLTAAAHYSLQPHSFTDNSRSESSYRLAHTANRHLCATIQDLAMGFPTLAIRHPHGQAGEFFPRRVVALSLTNIHQNFVLGATTDHVSKLARLRSLYMQSDGRFLTRDEGSFTYQNFKPIMASPTLQHLIFHGPFLQTMVDYAQGMFQFISTLHNLKSLVVDFDMVNHSSDRIIRLFQGLPNLTRRVRVSGGNSGSLTVVGCKQKSIIFSEKLPLTLRK